METKNLADLYDLEPLDWAPVAAQLDKGLTQAPHTGGPDRHTFWLATINQDGSPHVTGFGAFWDEGRVWIVTSANSRKGRNLARDPRCTISVAAPDYDIVLEGEAHLVTQRDEVARVAATAAADGWPARVDDSGTAITAEFSAPSAGPPPWHVYRMTPKAATALWTEEPGGATRWTF